MEKAPRWIYTHSHRSTFACCQGWLRLGRSSVLIFCKNDLHVPRERGIGKGTPTAFILKRFDRRYLGDYQKVVRYNMRYRRALEGRKPKIDLEHRTMDGYAGWGGYRYVPMEFDYKKHPLTDEEWMYATALMYFLGGN